MQINRKSFGTLKSDRYGRVAAKAGFTVFASINGTLPPLYLNMALSLTINIAIIIMITPVKAN